MESFGERVTNLLREKRMTQKDLAKLSNITEASLSRYISGILTPRIDVINNIAIALDVSPSYLLGEIDQIKRNESAYQETYRVVARNKGSLTKEEKTELIELLFGGK